MLPVRPRWTCEAVLVLQRVLFSTGTCAISAGRRSGPVGAPLPDADGAGRERMQLADGASARGPLPQHGRRRRTQELSGGFQRRAVPTTCLGHTRLCGPESRRHRQQHSLFSASRLRRRHGRGRAGARTRPPSLSKL